MIGTWLRRLLLPVAFLVVVVVRLMRPVFLVRFGLLFSVRIGHFAANTEVYLCEREAGMHPLGLLGGVDLWAHKGHPCNRQLARMIRRRLWIEPTGFGRLLYMANRSMPGWEAHEAAPEQHDRDIHNLMEKQSQHIRFNHAELKKGLRLRRAMGIPDGTHWVCLVVRDGAYLNDPAFSYHKFRNSKIGTYRKAALALAGRGYYVVRMGAAVEEPFHMDDPHVIDYATNGMRSEFMDIYLMAHCAFAVSCGTGLDSVAAIFRRPICFVNCVPFEYVSTWIPGLTIFKHHLKRGREMSLEEIIASGAGQFLQADEFKRARIRLKDNTPDEIEAAVLEMADAVEGPIYESSRQQDLDKQRDFWQHFPLGGISTYNARPLHGEVRLRVGREFLRQQA